MDFFGSCDAAQFRSFVEQEYFINLPNHPALVLYFIFFSRKWFSEFSILFRVFPNKKPFKIKPHPSHTPPRYLSVTWTIFLQRTRAIENLRSASTFEHRLFAVLLVCPLIARTLLWYNFETSKLELSYDTTDTRTIGNNKASSNLVSLLSQHKNKSCRRPRRRHPQLLEVQQVVAVVLITTNGEEYGIMIPMLIRMRTTMPVTRRRMLLLLLLMPSSWR